MSDIDKGVEQGRLYIVGQFLKISIGTPGTSSGAVVFPFFRLLRVKVILNSSRVKSVSGPLSLAIGHIGGRWDSRSASGSELRPQESKPGFDCVTVSSVDCRRLPCLSLVRLTGGGFGLPERFFTTLYIILVSPTAFTCSMSRTY